MNAIYVSEITKNGTCINVCSMREVSIVSYFYGFISSLILINNVISPYMYISMNHTSVT